MTNSHVEKKQQSIIRPRPATLLGVLVAIAINFAILQPAAAASDGLALKTTMPTAAEGTAKSAEDVARELANPNSSLATLTLKNQYRWYTGDLPDADDQDNYTMVLQPVFPLSLPKDGSGDNRTVFIRPGIPLLFDQPVPSAEDGGFDWDGVSALGDIGLASLTVSRKKTVSCGPWVWWVPCLLLPTKMWEGNNYVLAQSSYWLSSRNGASMAFSQAINGMLLAGLMNLLVRPSSNPCSRSFWAMAGQQGLRP